MSIGDAQARRSAIDPGQSVCVSAPAGSGKTSLLVQRFLTLLPRVESPESVVAITFTRKAAAEMRARLVTALQAAGRGEEGGSDYERTLLGVARKALAHGAARGWDLIENPARLSIQTIDSFCGELTRQMPVLSGCGGSLATTDDVGPLCELAVARFLRRELGKAGEPRVDLERVLMHVDNRWDAATDLLVQLLQRREQWQPVFGGRGLNEAQRPALLRAVEDLVQHRIACLNALLGHSLPALEEAFAWRARQSPHLPVFDADSEHIAAWRPLADLLLTKSGTWRKSVTKNDGFPPGKGEAAERKAALVALLDEFREHQDDELRQALIDLRLLPSPDASTTHWQVLLSLTRLLPRLAAELLLVFQERGEVDHAQIAMAALAALGTDDAPTDLALRLDHRIDHLLVDEFQDTSTLQFELVRRLTRGWAEHNAAAPETPRTLLLVGDPMQSIYGFREANVGLFIRARDEGMGDLHLVPLDLSVNFRSTESLIAWTNRCFTKTFPQNDDAELGAVSFTSAVSARRSGAEPIVRLFAGDGAEAEEASALCAAVRKGLQDPNTRSLAILGRSRSHLRPFLAALRAEGIAYAAQDFDRLGSRPIVADLLTLTAVLLDPVDRYSWLSLLRTPSLALDHTDLLAMAHVAPTAAGLLSVNAGEVLGLLSGVAAERIEHLRSVLLWADHFRERLAPRVWIEETWLRLGGAGAIGDEADRLDAEQFFRLLERVSADPRGLRFDTLESALDKEYARAGDDRCQLQVMTLHKAKGLEFDRVYIPALGKGTRRPDKPLLLWEEVTLPGRASSVLLDVRGAAGAAAPDQLYAFLERQQERKRVYEAARLLYVGCTRAENHLWLSACVTPRGETQEISPPRSGSLLSYLWNSLGADLPVTWTREDGTAELETLTYRRLSKAEPIDPPAALVEARGIVFHDNRPARSLGTAIHRVLESLVYRSELPLEPDRAMCALLRIALIESGTERSLLAEQTARATPILARSLQDPWLRWALGPERPERRAELPITLVDEEPASRGLVIDYSFLDEKTGERWIIDYKTSAPQDEQTLAAFLAEETDRYAEQLLTYRLALKRLGYERIRCALYFPVLGARREITPVR